MDHQHKNSPKREQFNTEFDYKKALDAWMVATGKKPPPLNLAEAQCILRRDE
ncbi:hypothetical protein PN836_017560 [Ningiella sp. W23]|uniref:hypothetical protein n=1 Tax=Ningiella sp. W23 TaxID=3023715 RepID=UPI0037572A84